MQKPLLVFLFFFIFCFSASGQSIYTIKGVVLDAENKEQLIGATVSVEVIKRNTRVGLDGSYALSNLAAGTYKLRCSFLGYQTKDTTIVLKNNDRLNFFLQNTSAILNNVEIAGKINKETDASVRKHEQLADNVVNLVSAKAIQLSPDITVANVLQRVSGVSVERSGSGDGRYAIIRGMDKRYNYTLINGIKVPSPDNKNRYVPLDIFPSDLVERLEISKTLTPDMEGDAIGGVVNIVMKNAPDRLYLNASISTGANQYVLDHGLFTFPVNAINRKSPYESNGPGYLAKPEDFTRDNLNYTKKDFKPNLFANFSIGNRFLNNKLGVMLGGSYQNAFRTYTNVFAPGDQYIDKAGAPGVLQIKHASGRVYSTQVSRIGLNAKLDYRFNDNNKISAYAFHAILDDAQFRATTDTIQTPPRVGYGTGQVWYFFRSKYQHQSITNTTLDGQHNIIPGLKFNWIGAYSLAKSNVPDLAEYEYDSGFFSDGTSAAPYQHPNKLVDYHRIWENNSDKDLSGYANLAYTNKLLNIPFTITGGAMYRNKKRNNRFQDYLLRPVPNEDGTFQEWTDIYNFKWSVSNPDGSPENANTYRANEDVFAGFGMLKFKLSNLETLVGLRVENTKQHYDTDVPNTQAGKIGDKTYSDYLPSVNFKYVIGNKTNIRLAYFASINRPSFFELVPAPRKGDEYNEIGNPELKHATADNFDFRYEIFPKSNEQILIGAFYKQIHNPIEFGFTNSKFDTYAPQNFGDATNFGFELVYEKYLRNFGIRANYTYTNSAITTTKFQTIDKQNVAPLQKRPLQGQSANIANAALLYKSVNNGIDVQLTWQYTGERIALVSPYYEFDQWQKGTNTFDFSGEKRFKNHLVLFAKIHNLFNVFDKIYIKQPTTGNAVPVSYQDPGSDRTLASQSQFGRNYQLGLRYSL